jgi:peroxiredoxin
MVKQAPKVGDFLPEGSFADKNGATVSLTAAMGEKPAVVTFYRGGWCPYCNIQLRHYQKMLPEIKALGAELVAITPELPDQSLSTQQKNELEFVVLSDRDNAYAKQLKIVFALTPELREVYRQFGIDLEKSHGNTAWELPLAATFVVDATRRITYAFVDSDYTKRAEPEQLLKAVKRVTRQ